MSALQVGQVTVLLVMMVLIVATWGLAMVTSFDMGIRLLRGKPASRPAVSDSSEPVTFAEAFAAMDYVGILDPAIKAHMQDSVTLAVVSGFTPPVDDGEDAVRQWIQHMANTRSYRVTEVRP